MSLARMKNSIMAWKIPGRWNWNMHRRLRHLAADIGHGENDTRNQTPDRVQTAEEDTMIAVKIARGEAEIDGLERAREFQRAGKACLRRR